MKYAASVPERRRVLFLRENMPARRPIPERLLAVEGVGLVRGDVEIHLNQRDWEGHGHSDDPNYNGVVLHAMLEVESPNTPLRSGGSRGCSTSTR